MIIGREFAIINGFLGTVVLCATQGMWYLHLESMWRTDIASEALIALRIYRSLGMFSAKSKMVLKFGFILEFGLLLSMQAIASVRVGKLEDNGQHFSCTLKPPP